MRHKSASTKVAQGQFALPLTRHATRRLGGRRIPEAAVSAALLYGHLAYTRGATIYAIGRREVDRMRREGLDLSPFQGVQVVCSKEGTILTAYRNRDLRTLKLGCRHRRPHGAHGETAS